MEWKRCCALHRKQIYGIILLLLVCKGSSTGEKKVQAILGLTSSLAKELYEHDQQIKQKSEKFHTKVNELVKDGSQESLDDVAKYMFETINQYSFEMMMNVLKCLSQHPVKFTEDFDEGNIDDTCQFSKQGNSATSCLGMWELKKRKDEKAENFKTCVDQHTRYGTNQSEPHAFLQLGQFYRGLLNSTIKDFCKYLNKCCSNKVRMKTNHDGPEDSGVAANPKTFKVGFIIVSALLIAICCMLVVGWWWHERKKKLNKDNKGHRQQKNVDASQKDSKVKESIEQGNMEKERGTLLD